MSETPRTDDRRRHEVQSVRRALELLDAIADSGGVASITALAEETGLPAPTVHRLAQTLVSAGYLRRAADRGYALGSRLAALGASATAHIGTRARAVLRELAGTVGESANLAVLSAGTAEYVAQAAGPHAMRLFTEVGRRVPLHSTGVGKALLARLDDDRALRILLDEGMPAATEATVTSPAAMLPELARIRELGYAIDDEEMEIGVRCVAVAFRAAGSEFAVSVSGPAVRLGTEVVPRVAEHVRSAAERLVQRLDPD